MLAIERRETERKKKRNLAQSVAPDEVGMFITSGVFPAFCMISG